MLTSKSEFKEVMEVISSIKAQSLNIIADQLNKNGSYLEPRELKILSDTALTIEDSIVNRNQDNATEGEKARKIQRLLDKYNTNHSDILVQPTIVSSDSVRISTDCQ